MLRGQGNGNHGQANGLFGTNHDYSSSGNHHGLLSSGMHHQNNQNLNHSPFGFSNPNIQFNNNHANPYGYATYSANAYPNQVQYYNSSNMSSHGAFDSNTPNNVYQPSRIVYNQFPNNYPNNSGSNFGHWI
jgi:hypothetical protein